jgi:DNA-directed RNA polymerase specialized sigma subunit
MDCSIYSSDINQYRRQRLQEENRGRPRQEISLNHTLLDTLSITVLQKSREGKWRQPESLHHYDSSDDLAEPFTILIERIQREIAQLPKRERTIVRFYYKGSSHEDIAARVHCCRRRVGQLLEWSITQIRRNILSDQTNTRC